jgi:hypothetical protein
VRRVPVVHHAIDVVGSPDACWKVLTDLAGWPRWFPRLKYASVLGDERDPWRTGGRFAMVFDAGIAVSVKVTVEELEPAARVRWVGGGLGISGDHVYTLEVKNPGTTRVTSHEEFSGIGARLINGRIKQIIDDEVHRSMARFKALVEGA